MSFKAGDAVVFLRTDDSELKSGLDEGKQKVSGWGGAVQGLLMGVGFAAFNAIADAAKASVGYLGDAISAASDMGETISKTGVLFGDAADELIVWSEKSALGFGQSKQQALDAATTFATFGKAAGLVGKDLVSFSTDFTELASDLASFNNTTPEQAIDAIGAALRGEAEPLRAYGVLLDDASLRQKALKLGIIDNIKKALTPQQKVLAAQALIYEQTSAAQGDFARTSGGLANQQRILDAQWTNMQATIGEGLLPVQLALTSAMSELLQVVLPPLVGFITGSVVPAMTAFGNIIGSLIRYFTAVIEDGDTWNDWLSELPKPLQNVAFFIAEVFIPAIKSIGGALGGLFNYFTAVIESGDAWNDWLTHVPTLFQPFALAIGNVIPIITSLANTFFSFLQYLTGAPDTYSKNSTALSLLPEPLQIIAVFIKETIIPAFSQFIETLVTFQKTLLLSTSAGSDLYKNFLEKLPEPLQEISLFISGTLVPTFLSLVDTIAKFVGPVINALGPLFTQFGMHLSNVVDNNLVYFKKWFDTNLPLIQKLVGEVTAAITAFWKEHGESITLFVTTFLNWMVAFWDTQFKTILDIITLALQLLTGDFEGAGKTLEGILNRWKEFITRAFTAIVDGIKNIWKSIDWGGVGRGILEGIASGLRNGGSFIADAAKSAAQGAFDAAKDFLGIHSPSKLAAAEIGKPFAEGIGVGIKASLADMVGGINVGLNGLMGGIATPQASAAGAINITVNVSGGGDSAGIGIASRDGVLNALRSAGLR